MEANTIYYLTEEDAGLSVFVNDDFFCDSSVTCLVITMASEHY